MLKLFYCAIAPTDSQGKLNVLGAFDHIFVKTIPCVHPASTIAARVRFAKIEQGEHEIKINVIDQDGKSIGPKLEGKVGVRHAEDADSAVTNIILNIQGLRLEKYGEYRIDLAIDGRQGPRCRLY